ncbi:hypothetical protein BDW02DRAFT_106850 [Decorospora gaudefroyi]|uniref:Uncharacterized protein n=1 Tax=Decorospora gaudefroyi TaxID=184978 RepID=A0A6A5KT44_9PLEO|nr:hypothetical protein BDW02DRAFT_106850 [Decorospora gaudefroyi]
MSSKRKHSLEDDYVELQPLKKRTRRTTRGSVAVESSDNGDYHSPPQTNRRNHKAAAKSSKSSKKTDRLAAELANLADFNKPPVQRTHAGKAPSKCDDKLSKSLSDGDDAPRTSRPTRKPAKLTDKLRVKGARVTKPTANSSSKKRSREDKLLAEVAKLTPWYGWASEDEESGSESEDEIDHSPRVHSRHYPPKRVGTQNVPWSELCGEIRNAIYRRCMLNEVKKVINVRHYPDGVPRRSVRGITSTTNFAFSHWSFTQVCKQTREELTPWLLTKRKVRTALKTITNYVETFHRPNADGERIGWVEPVCCGAPLPGDGVEVLNLLKLKHDNPDIHLQFSPTEVSPVLTALTTLSGPDDFDELKIMHDMDLTFTDWWKGSVLDMTGLEGIHITSILLEETDEIEDPDEKVPHDILIKLAINEKKACIMTHNKRLQYINSFIFRSGLSDKQDVKLEATFDTGVAIWKVRRAGVVDMCWKAGEVRGPKVFRRLSVDTNNAVGYTQEEL